MKITNKNNKLTTKGGWLNYTIEDDEITIDIVCAETPKKGIGTALVKKMQEIARDMELPIGLYAEPCAACDTQISEDALISFYKKLGFENDENDTDGKLLIWK